MNYLVVGGSSGIGKEYLENLNLPGHVVVIGKRKVLDFEISHSHDYVSIDLSNSAAISEFINSNVIAFDRVLFSAGYLENNPLQVFDPTKWLNQLSVNLSSIGLLLGGLYRKRKINKNSNIVIISSINGTVRGSKGCIGYASAKAGIEGFVRVFANEVGKKLIKINCISPGMVITPLMHDLNHISQEQLELDMKRYPLGEKYAETSDIIKFLDFLLEDNTYITGQNIVIDGGHTIAG